MSASFPPTSSPTLPPWHERQLSYGAKLLAMAAVMVLSIIALITGIVLAFMVPSLLTQGLGPRDTLQSVAIGLSIYTVLFAGSVAGLVVLVPRLNTGTRFTPSYGLVPADVRSHPIEARFRRILIGRSFSGKGELCFGADSLELTSYLTPPGWFQLLVVLVVTLVPAVLLGIGLGLLPALLIAHYLGRKRATISVPYVQLDQLSVKGCRVRFGTGGARPRAVAFSIAASDGERLYRELSERLPALLLTGQR